MGYRNDAYVEGLLEFYKALRSNIVDPRPGIGFPVTTRQIRINRVQFNLILNNHNR